MALPREFVTVLDRARAEAKRLGHGEMQFLHVALALEALYPERYAAEFSEAAREVVRVNAARIPRTFAAVKDDPRVLESLEVSARERDPVKTLWFVVRSLFTATDESGAKPAAPAAAGPAEAASSAVTESGFRPALPLLVTLLLERALDTVETHRVLGRYLRGDDDLCGFARFMYEAAPVVVVESEFPFAEEVIHAALVQRLQPPPGLLPLIAKSEDHDETRVHLTIPDKDRYFVLIALHGGRSLVQLDRVAHELGSRDVGTLIGCSSFATLPESLRRIADVRLELPPIDESTFEKLFEGIFGERPADGWRDRGASWVRLLQPTDFEQPQRLGLSAAEALGFLRAQVEERLRAVEPVTGRSLDQLYGLGEALQFARDLIAEIQAAVAGRMPWQDVDRGVLLAGPPGTGKTTLARAIAKDCGVKFITASVTGWQAAGHLGDHIRAIRATFAEARRYAPSILFLDEIDSLGSRELLGGNNAQYQTEVINAVLEQMQGLDPTAPVFVIAATNHPEKVDPALRRAGRLDRVMSIPYPNTQALGAMFADYLEAHRSGAGLDPAGVDTALLGKLAFGLTGADVERAVRGAARRARRARRPINTEDLIAEITNKPREDGGAHRLSAAEMERVAIHEAGHALARYLSSSEGKDLGFVSIVPRADGTLGFVALAPDERVLESRRDSLERIDVLMAGRAAEELRFGSAEISGGCSNDLAVATRIALSLITRQGLGARGRLVSVDTPSADHYSEADEMLTASYRDVLKHLQTHRARLDRLARALIEKQELSADEVRALLARG